MVQVCALPRGATHSSVRMDGWTDCGKICVIVYRIWFVVRSEFGDKFVHIPLRIYGFFVEKRVIRGKFVEKG